jgi:hypothetical protein
MHDVMNLVLSDDVLGFEEVLSTMNEEQKLDCLFSTYGFGRTLLHVAAAVGSVNMVKKLLSLGLSPALRDDAGQRAVDLSPMSWGGFDIKLALLSRDFSAKFELLREKEVVSIC